MKTAPLVVAVVAGSLLPVILSSFGCNKKEDAAPIPIAAVVAPKETAVVPAAPPIAVPVQPSIPLIKTTPPRTDAGARGDAAAPAVRPDAAPPPIVALPPGIPTIALPHPSALPSMAASVVGGIIKTFPPPIIPTPNPSQ